MESASRITREEMVEWELTGMLTLPLKEGVSKECLKKGTEDMVEEEMVGAVSEKGSGSGC